MPTVVAFHAHPDDEVILTGGTLARAAAAGHRVVVVVATDGRVHDDDPARLDELRASADILGVHRVECLGYADSGYGPAFHPDPPGRVRFARADVVRTAYAPRATITHRIDVRRFARQKRDALIAHRSQTGGIPVWSAALRLVPPPMFALAFGREWFIDPQASPGRLCRDIFERPAPR